MTKLVDPHADLILVGDSLAMTIYGMASTQDMMICPWPCGAILAETKESHSYLRTTGDGSITCFMESHP
jgi:hypothetical protein